MAKLVISAAHPLPEAGLIDTADGAAALGNYKGKWVVLNFPHTPAGAALTRDEVAALAAVLMRHPHVWVMSDEMYEHISYVDTGFHSIAAVEPGLRDRDVARWTGEGIVGCAGAHGRAALVAAVGATAQGGAWA